MAWQSRIPAMDCRVFMYTFVGNSLHVVRVPYLVQPCICIFQKHRVWNSWNEGRLGSRGSMVGRTLRLPRAQEKKHIAVVSMQRDGKGILSGKAWWSGLLTGTILFALLIPYVANLASDNNVTLTEDEVNWKLRQIPVFAVTDDEGKPFLLESPVNDNQREGYFFVDKDDALSFKELVTSQDATAKTKIFPLTLDIAERFIQGKIDSNYVSSSDKFHLAPNVEDLEFADSISNSKFDRADVPVFAVDKLRLEVQIPSNPEANNREDAVPEQPQVKRITPLFLKKQDVESLLSTVKKNSESNFEPMIRVYKFSELLTNLKKGEFGSLDDFIFYPPEESLEYIKVISSL